MRKIFIVAAVVLVAAVIAVTVFVAFAVPEMAPQMPGQGSDLPGIDDFLRELRDVFSPGGVPR